VHRRSAKEWPLVAAVAAMDVAAVVVEAVAGVAEVEVLGAAVSMSPVPPAGEVDAALADAAASSLEAVSAALPAGAAEAVPHPAGYGRQLGAGSIAVWVALRLRLSHLASRRNKWRRLRTPRRQLTEMQLARVQNSVSTGLSVN
jgi:hypothetical protein